MVDQSQSQPDAPAAATKPSDTSERLDGDLLNGGTGQTSSPNDPPNQGAEPTPDDDLLHGGTGKPESA